MPSRQTSVDAYRQLQASGALSRCRWLVYDCLFHHGPMTRNELDSALKGPSSVNPTFSRRLVELERMGLAMRGATKQCRVTGFECDAWDVTDRAEPLRLKEGPKRKPAPEVEALAERLERVEARLRDLDGRLL